MCVLFLANFYTCEERERDLIRFNKSGTPTNKQTKKSKFKERLNEEIEKEKSQTNFFFSMFYTRALV